MIEPDRSLLDRVLDRMAHQLKNPLQAIVVNLEVVRLRTRQERPEAWEAVKPYADAIDSNVKLLDRRLRLLIQLSRSDQGPEEVDVGALVEELVQAGRLDEPPAPVRVEKAGWLPTARARRGPLVALLFLALERLRREREAADGEVRVRIHAGPGMLFLDLGLAVGPGRGEEEREKMERREEGPEETGVEKGESEAEPRPGGDAWDDLVRAACESGVDVRRVEAGRGARLRIALPRA